MSKYVAIVSIMIIGWIIQILVMENGWGLEIKSWGWIIGGFILSYIVMLLLATIVKE